MVLVRIEADCFQLDATVHVRRYLPVGIQFTGDTLKPMMTVEASATIDRIAPGDVITQLPVFILLPWQLDHVYVLAGTDMTPNAGSSSSGSGAQHFTTAPPRATVPASDARRPAALDSTGSRSRQTDRPGSPASSARGRFGTDLGLDLYDPMPFDFGTRAEPQQLADRRQFRRGMLRGVPMERGSLVRFEAEAGIPADRPGACVGDVIGLWQAHGEQYVQVEVVIRDEDAGWMSTGIVKMLPPSSIMEVL
jgi:hypothetical protein